MRALYQRKKGRDLYDLYMVLTAKEMDLTQVIESYQKYTGFVTEHIPTYKEYMEYSNEYFYKRSRAERQDSV